MFSGLFGSYQLSILIFIILALVPVFARFGAEGFILDLINRAILLALAAIALDLILGFGGIGSIRGAFITALVIGLVDTLGRSMMTDILKLFMDASAANQIGPAIASMLIYVLMGLFAPGKSA